MKDIILLACQECAAVFICYTREQVDQMCSHECNNCTEGAVEPVGIVAVKTTLPQRQAATSGRNKPRNEV
jgi:hypothetical protein